LRERSDEAIQGRTFLAALDERGDAASDHIYIARALVPLDCFGSRSQ
jgi:hypothetical protein